MLIERFLIWQRGPRRPDSLQLASRLLRLPWLVGNDAHEVLSDDHLHDARKLLDGLLVHGHERGAMCRRPYDAAVQHAGYANVVRVLEAAGRDRRKVEPGHG